MPVCRLCHAGTRTHSTGSCLPLPSWLTTRTHRHTLNHPNTSSANTNATHPDTPGGADKVLPRLTRLSLVGARVDAARLRALLRMVPGLRVLELSGCVGMTRELLTLPERCGHPLTEVRVM